MPQQIFFDPELVRRYNRPGPRYTSYPTVSQFNAHFNSLDYRRAALLSNTDPFKPLSAYVHVPFCANPCFYCGGNKIMHRDRGMAQDYIRRLKIEITLQARLFDPRRRLRQIHLGGGTPTHLSMEQLEDILDHLVANFEADTSQQRDFAIEIDPRSLQAITLRGLKTLGFNRISIGVHDFDPMVQRAIDRIQPAELTRKAAEQAHAAGFKSISFDLIYGLPLQSFTSFANTLTETLSMRPSRVALYSYAHLPRFIKEQYSIREKELPSSTLSLQLLQLAVETLTAAGYVYIGLDHFALPEDELAQAQRTGTLQRNFQGYSTHADCDLIGLGVSAIGKPGDTYSQNARQLSEYYEALDRGLLPIERGLALTVDDLTRYDIIQRIMCGGMVDFKYIEKYYALKFQHYFARELTALQQMFQDGLLSELGSRLVVSAKGQLLLHHIAMVFDAYLSASAPNRFSKSV